MKRINFVSNHIDAGKAWVTIFDGNREVEYPWPMKTPAAMFLLELLRRFLAREQAARRGFFVQATWGWMWLRNTGAAK